MPNVTHASLTGADLHEPKGVASTTLGNVYVANGAGSGSWQRLTQASVSVNGIGYPSGAGGTVTQATSKATGVTLSKICGQITMNNAALAAATIVSFTFTNTLIEATDQIVISHISGGTGGAYTVTAFPGAGSATIYVRNNTAGSLGEAIVLGFSILKSATS